MKRYFYFLIISVLAIIMVSCQSKEEKAAELIKKELAKTLYDFDSYQPIETIVTEAKMTMYNDTTCWNKAIEIAYTMKTVSKYIEESNEAKERMDIWQPSYYSSTYSINQYHKYKEEYEEKMTEAQVEFSYIKDVAADLKKMITKLDTSKVIGWNVKHSFRCKTKGGYSDICEYRYVIDKDFKTILLREDTGGEDSGTIHDVLKSVVTGAFDE